MSTASFGARPSGRGAFFAVPAPNRAACAVRLFDRHGRALETIPMVGAPNGIFTLESERAGAGTRYRYVLDGVETTDPFARFLPEGVDAPASVESLGYRWKHAPLGGAANDVPIYELHVGTFTPEGTYRSAATRLAELADLGVGAVELMPLAAFPGTRGWGYDGVAHFAPFAPYGTRDELAAFIDEAHGLGLRVYLDVVYNHFGPHGNTLRAFVPEAFTSRFASPWGESPDFANPVMRAYALDNVRYWLGELRFDGLRIDAAHALHDDGPVHILAEIAQVAHECEPRRLVIAEDERNEPALMHELRLDAVWADDFHHQMHVLLTRERDGYYGSYAGDAEALAQTINLGWSYSGETYPLTGKPRGRPATDLASAAFVYCLQNHDQIGNRGRGERLNALVDPDAFAAASFVMLLLPMTPLLFMGQEWGARSPFLYFTDHEAELGRAITEGRRKEFAHFEAFGETADADQVPDPQLESTWAASRLDWAERSREPHASLVALYRTLLHLRATDPVLRDADRARTHARNDGGLLVVDRTSGTERRRILANLTNQTVALSEELTRGWRVLLVSSPAAREAQRALDTLPKHTAVLLEPTP